MTTQINYTNQMHLPATLPKRLTYIVSIINYMYNETRSSKWQSTDTINMLQASSIVNDQQCSRPAAIS